MFSRSERIRNLIREYSSRIRESEFKNVETELSYFLYECEVDAKQVQHQPKLTVRRKKI